MSLIAVEAAITIADPSTRQELIERSAPIQQATRDDEPGCLVYCFAADPCQDDLIQVYELWESEESLAAHFDHPNYHDIRAMLGAGGLVSAVSRKHRIDATAPVYGADHVATREVRLNAPVPTSQAVVFDFGGVLITTIVNQVGKVAASHNVETRVMHEVLLGPRVSGDHPWHRAERGELAVADIQSQLGPWAASAGVTLHGDEIDRLLAVGEYVVVDEMVECVAALRSDGYVTGLLTNTFAEFRPTLERDLDLAQFDVVVESYAVGTRKPERGIYATTQERLGVEPETIVYLDDFDQNLEPAIALGWTTILVQDHDTAINELHTTLGRSGCDSN